MDEESWEKVFRYIDDIIRLNKFDSIPDSDLTESDLRYLKSFSTQFSDDITAIAQKQVPIKECVKDFEDICKKYTEFPGFEEGLIYQHLMELICQLKNTTDDNTYYVVDKEDTIYNDVLLLQSMNLGWR